MHETVETTANDIQRAEMARQIERLAAELRNTAERVERYARQLNSTDREAAAIAADALNEYEQANAGPIVWGIVRELSRTH